MIASFTFNTGRLYTEAGQIIRVEVSDGRVWFYDESRMIAGSMLAGNLSGEREIREAIMFCYDRGLYKEELLPNGPNQARRRGS